VHRLHNKLDDSIGTKGDVFVHDGTSWVQLAVGTNAYVIVADSAQASGVKWAAQSGSSGGGLSVSRLTVNTTLTDQGIYIVDSSVAIRTITLPLLSAVPSTGYRIHIKREGVNNVILQRQSSDTFEDSTTTKTLFTNWSGFVCFADDAATAWMIGGFFGSVS